MSNDAEAAVELRNRVAGFVALQETEDLRAILATVGGRRFVWNTLELTGLYADDFRGEETHAMARATGKRSIGLTLLEKVLTANPNAYILMRSEAIAFRREIAERLKSQETE